MFNKKPKVYADVECDIEGLKAFSVERLNRDETCVGYRIDGKVHEWYLQCSPEKHQNFVDRLRAVMAKKEVV